MASDDHALSRQKRTPLFLVTKVAVVVVQAGLIFLLREASEVGPSRMVFAYKKFFTVKNWWIF